MKSNGGNAVFLDTTIQITRQFKSSLHRKTVAKRLKTFGFRMTSSIVRQEFKRRVIGDAVYVLGKLVSRDNLQDALQSIGNLPVQQNRKLRISLDLFASLLLKLDGTEAERRERAILVFKSIIETWRDQFDASVDLVVEGTQCAASNATLRAQGNTYVKPSDYCSSYHDCPVTSFLTSSDRSRDIAKIRSHFSATPMSKSDEIRESEAFLTSLETASGSVTSREPCRTVGDLLIALESAVSPTFYTMNYKESKHFCKALSQNLVILPSNDEKPEIELRHEDSDNWTFPGRAPQIS